MGAGQSSGSGGSRSGTAAQNGEVKTCYYELLGIDPKSSEDEIKKAYRQKALELHPDRNYGNAEAATKQFANVQSAYEVLSDPSERAWYDSHRDSILREGNSGENYEHNNRITTAEDILQMFSKFNRRVDFSDSSTGFFGALRELFDNLVREEEAACEWNGLNPIQYPSFGYKDDAHEDVVGPFYAVWDGFATKKKFTWKDFYSYSEAPDRQIRRMMEKENKRFRDEGIREFNDAVRSLVAFIRKRDPRFKPNKQSEADRQKILKDAAIAQAARSRAANQTKLKEEAVPDWMRANTADAGDATDDEWAEIIPTKQDVECVVCNKIFKSEKQYDAHEKSKKHIKAVEQIRRQMQREDRDMNLDVQDIANDSPKIAADAEIPQSSLEEDASEHLDAGDRQSSLEKSEAVPIDMDERAAKSQDHDLTPVESESDSAPDDDYALRKEVEQRLISREIGSEEDSVMQGAIAESPTDALAEKVADESFLDNTEITNEPKLGKAKERRAKKAAQQSSPNAQPRADLKCARCSEGFPSKTQLFRHIKQSRHEQPVQEVLKGGKGKRL